MLEKLAAQNKAVCENEGKQCVLSDHWKSIKMLFKNKWMTQKCKKIDWNTSFNRRVNFVQNQI